MTTWQKADVERFLQTENLNYQQIKLPFGLSTPGHDRREMCDIAFDKSLKGQTVLDVGSYLGYFCLEALARGASDAVGLEVNPHRLAQARTLAEIKGVRPRYELADCESYRTDEKFDIVLCLNVLHHLFNPIGALHKLSRMAKRTLILEVASLSGVDVRAHKLEQKQSRLLSSHPTIYVAPGSTITSDPNAAQKYFFSEEAIVNILGGHMKLFADIEVLSSPFPGRFVIRATRRRIGHLVIISGASGSGKTSFLRRLRDRELPASAQVALPDEAEGWSQVDANNLFHTPLRDNDGRLLTEAEMEGLVLHYDIVRPHTTRTHSYKRDPALDLCDCADRVTVLLLKPETDQLIEQFVSSKMRVPHNVGHNGSQSWAARCGGALPGRLRGLARYVTRRNDSPTGRGTGDPGWEMKSEVLRNYRRPGWLEDLYEGWKAHVADACHSATVVELGVCRPGRRT